MIPQADLKHACQIITNGGVIAYPTEGVFGLGCDPFNANAVQKLLELKHRDIKKGLILIASDWEQIRHLVTPISPERLTAIQKTWPGPYTWVFPASKKVPPWIRGAHTTVALRVTAHPIAKQLCQYCKTPLVSTSANLKEQLPAKNIADLTAQFGRTIDSIVPGALGTLNNPTRIRDALTNEILRGGQ